MRAAAVDTLGQPGRVDLFNGRYWAELKADRFMQVDTYPTFAPHAGRSITLVFELRARVPGTVLVYGYQASGISIRESFTIQATTEWRRYTIRTTVHDFQQVPWTKGAIAVYYPASTDQNLWMRRVWAGLA